MNEVPINQMPAETNDNADAGEAGLIGAEVEGGVGLLTGPAVVGSDEEGAGLLYEGQHSAWATALASGHLSEEI